MKYPVHVVCTDCGEEWEGDVISDGGDNSLAPREDCPSCGSTMLDAEPLDEIDINERKERF